MIQCEASVKQKIIPLSHRLVKVVLGLNFIWVILIHCGLLGHKGLEVMELELFVKD